MSYWDPWQLVQSHRALADAHADADDVRHRALAGCPGLPGAPVVDALDLER